MGNPLFLAYSSGNVYLQFNVHRGALYPEMREYRYSLRLRVLRTSEKRRLSIGQRERNERAILVFHKSADISIPSIDTETSLLDIIGRKT